MTVPSGLWIGVAAVALFAAIAVAALYRRSTRRTLKSIEGMLDAAMDNRFSETLFDESLLSALEAKFARFIAINSVSSTQLLVEKNKIHGLISDISHQTKTPIANLMLYSQLLGESDHPPESTACIEAVSAQAEKLSFLIAALVNLSRLETGIITVSPKPEAVQKLLDQVVEQIKPNAAAKNISLEMESTTRQAYFDLKWGSEALLNILDNAVKYTPQGGRISIKVTAYELFCRIDISDNGCGIAEEELSRIFQRFYRSPAVSAQEGAGIGLFLSRQIIMAGGGYIKVSSRLGAGSVFSVFLPVEK